MKSIPLKAPTGEVRAWQCGFCGDVKRSANRLEESESCCACVKCGKSPTLRTGMGNCCTSCALEASLRPAREAIVELQWIQLRPARGKWFAWAGDFAWSYFNHPGHDAVLGTGPTPEAALADLRAKAEALKGAEK